MGFGGNRGWISDSTKDLIRQIPVGLDRRRDKYIWPEEKSAKYSAKSGYQVLKEVDRRKDKTAPSSSHQKKLWLEILKLKVPGKIKKLSLETLF